MASPDGGEITMKNVLILAANGQIARIVEQRILNEPKFDQINLTLFLRDASRLAQYTDNPRVTLIEGDITDPQSISTAMENQDLVFVGVVDHDPQNRITNNVIQGMQAKHVQRVISTNVLGIYQEVGGEFGRWNAEMISHGMEPAVISDRLLEGSGLDYTTLRLPWLNDRNEINYQVTGKNEAYIGVSGSRQSVADVILQIIAEPTKYSRTSIGMADPSTEGETRPVY